MEEIELTYLAKIIPEGLKNFPSKELLDIYVPSSAEHPSLRIRKRGDVCEITKKEPLKTGDASHQMEITIPLTHAEFGDLNDVLGKRVRKIRYYYQEGKNTYEIDVFQDGLLGLVVVDIEFGSLKAKEGFVMPSWCLAEVTQEKFIAGGMICGKTYSDIEKNLAQFGYKKVYV